MDCLSFDAHPWEYEEARAEGFDRAFGLRAVDGDTIDVIVDPGYRERPQERLRLAGVDTPEIYGVPEESEEFEAGKEAQARVAELIEGEPLLILSGKDVGKYGQWISQVYAQISGGHVGRELSEILIAEGYDWTDRR